MQVEEKIEVEEKFDWNSFTNSKSVPEKSRKSVKFAGPLPIGDFLNNFIPRSGLPETASNYTNTRDYSNSLQDNYINLTDILVKLFVQRDISLVTFNGIIDSIRNKSVYSIHEKA
jgi:hypothetical protein